MDRVSIHEAENQLPRLIAEALDGGDPFDRFLIAQAHAEDMAPVSNEALFDSFAVQRLW